MKTVEDKRVIAETLAELSLQESATVVVPYVYIFRDGLFEQVKLEPVPPSSFEPAQAAAQLIERVQQLSLNRIYGAGLESRYGETAGISITGKGFDPPVAI